MLNERVYGVLLERVERTMLAFEVAMAIAFAGAAAVLAIHGIPHSEEVATGVTGFGALLVGVKAVLPLNKSAMTYGILHHGHRQHALDYKHLVDRVKKERGIGHDVRREHARLAEAHKLLAAIAPPPPSERLIKRIQEEVNRAIPPSELWFPHDAG